MNITFSDEFFGVFLQLKSCFLFFFFPAVLLQVAGDRRGTGQSLPGQRKLPRALLLHREAPQVLSDWSASGGEMGRLTLPKH